MATEDSDNVELFMKGMREGGSGIPLGVFPSVYREINSLRVRLAVLEAALEEAVEVIENTRDRGEELESLRAQLAEAQKDSQRMDWLEANMYLGEDFGSLVSENADQDGWRNAIDAATSGGEEGK